MKAMALVFRRSSGIFQGFLVALLLLGCKTTPHQTAEGPHAALGRSRSGYGSDTGGQPRLVVKTASLSVVVADLPEAAEEVARTTEAMGGIVLQAETSKSSQARFELRVPANRFSEALDTLSRLGEVESRSEQTADVTDEVGDIEAQLANKTALRDRLRLLLARTKDVKDVLAVEQELTRLQTDIDTIQGRLERLRRSVAMSSISATLIPKAAPRILGPLGYLWVGTRWFVTKLFVIRE